MRAYTLFTFLSILTLIAACSHAEKTSQISQESYRDVKAVNPSALYQQREAERKAELEHEMGRRMAIQQQAHERRFWEGQKKAALAQKVAQQEQLAQAQKKHSKKKPAPIASPAPAQAAAQAQ